MTVLPLVGRERELGVLEKIRSSDELRIAPIGPDGALRKPTAIWVVRLGHDLFVRSVNGRATAWFRGT